MQAAPIILLDIHIHHFSAQRYLNDKNVQYLIWIHRMIQSECCYENETKFDDINVFFILVVLL